MSHLVSTFFDSPVIALPAAAASWRARERRVVLLHELAHVVRRDAPRLLAARLACILHWPDPLAWRALGRLAVEHEIACDRRVLDHDTRIH